MKEGRKPEYPKKTPGDELQKDRVNAGSCDAWRLAPKSLEY